jgi:hypothetical protein
MENTVYGRKLMAILALFVVGEVQGIEDEQEESLRGKPLVYCWDEVVNTHGTRPVLTHGPLSYDVI